MGLWTMDDSPTDATSRGRQAVVEIAAGALRGRVVLAAVRLELADAFAGEMTAAELATRTGTDPDGLYRLLRALAALGFVEQQSMTTFALTDLGKLLRRDVEGSAWASVVFWSDLVTDSWTYLDECIRTGSRRGVDDAIARNDTKSRWALEPDPQAIFHAVFAEPTIDEQHAIPAAYDFSQARVVADLGGGGGSVLAAILLTNPALHGILVDQQGALDRAATRFKAHPFTGRCTLIASDLLKEIPAGADTYLLCSVLHGYDDDRALQLLANCRRAMSWTDVLLIVEPALPERASENPDLESMFISDLNMLVLTGGHERTLGDWSRLLDTAGFTLQRDTPIGDPSHRSILQASPRP